MPTVAVDKEDLFQLLGRTYTHKEFDELCFEFGIELDEDTTEDVKGTDERPQYKIEIAANRYDMLCIEGIAQALNEYLGKVESPEYTLKPAKPVVSLTVDPSTEEIRPYAYAAILRNVSFTPRNYESFMALQDKLHTNICRQRTLVAMGTHDLDTVKPPFVYKALPPEQIKFTPLNQTKEMNGKELMQFYEKDKNLGKYLHIIRDSPVYPVVLDSTGRVCSLPPIINSDHSKITMDTKNVFIEVTATDRTKANIVINQVVAMFSRYCGDKFSVEPVEIISDHNGETRICPDIRERSMSIDKDYINSCLALDLSTEQICQLLKKMALKATGSASDDNVINVTIPITRSDVLHQCDIMEDCAIAYGYNNLIKTLPKTEATVGHPLPINKVSDILRNASAQAGWLEVMTLTLCSHDENFKFLRGVDDNSKVVKLANPKTFEYQVVRTTLIPGILKTIRENKRHSLPIKVFEAGDIVLKDDSLERKARNQRNWCAVYAGKVSGFEYIQGLLGKIMQTFRTPWLEDPVKGKHGYWLEETEDIKMYFPGRGARIMLRPKDGEKAIEIGSIGVLHPEVCNNFDIPFAISSVEINAEVFL